MVDGNGQKAARKGPPLTEAVQRWVGDPALPIGLLAGIATSGILLAFWHRLGHDVGWLLVGANRFLQGDKLYVDGFVDVNPPLAVFLQAPAVVFAHVTAFSEVVALQLQVLIAAAAILLLCRSFLRRLMAGPAAVTTWYWLAAISFVCLVLPFLQPPSEAPEFAQREHWILLFIVPYVLVLALRLRSEDVSGASAIAAGTLMGLAVSMKPHYAPVLLSLELIHATSTQTVRSILRPELLIACGVGVAYLATVAVFVPGYFQVALPLALKTYWAYQTPIPQLVGIVPVLLLVVGCGALWLTPAAHATRTLCGLLLATSGACYCAYLLGGTSWPYHLLPFRAFIALALLAPLLGRIHTVDCDSLYSRARRAGMSIVTLVVVVGTIAVSPTSAGQILRSRGHHRSDEVSVVVQRLVEQYGAGGPIVVLSTALAGGFPAVNYAGVDWSLRLSCLWPLAAVVRTRSGEPGDAGKLSASDADEVERYLRQALASDLTQRPADLIFIHRGPRLQGLGRLRMDLLPFLRRDPEFASILSGYEPFRRIGPLVAYIRKDLRPEDSREQ